MTTAPPLPTPMPVPPPVDRALLDGWLRRAVRHPDASRLVLRGSLLLSSLCAGARRPADVDYLVLGDFDADAVAIAVRAIAAAPDPAGTTTLAVEATEIIFAETAFPGLRARLVGTVGADQPARFHVDLGFGDPLAAPPRAVELAGVGPVLACTAEVLFGWKLHGLVEHGRGAWRAKDLFDLDLMWRRVALDRGLLRPAVELAFSSRGAGLDAIDDFRARDSWGLSRSGARKWRSLGRRHDGLDDFLATRARVRAAVDAVLGA